MMKTLKKLMVLPAVCLVSSFVWAAEPLRPPIVTYVIDAKLDASNKVIRGEQTIRWRNTSESAVDRIPLHLYMNAFRPGSTFMRESGGRHRGIRSADEGRIDLSSLAVDGMDRLKEARYIQPDDANESDRTLLEIPLPNPVATGQTVELQMAFAVHLPRVFARTGWADDFFMAGQWYPKPAVLEPAGRRGRRAAGWNLHQYHARSEYYADFADFDVSITTPREHRVGATGHLVGEQVEGASRRTRWVARNVHDFAWTSSPSFVERVLEFDPANDIPPGFAREAARLFGEKDSGSALRPVRVRFLMQESNLSQLERYRSAVFATLAWCGLRFGPYPYGELTVVDPPLRGWGAGGMEYPMLVTGLSHRAADVWPLPQMLREAEAVLVHEVAHQYWYGLIASNEFEESWMDEGLTSWTEQEIMDRLFPGGRTGVPFLPRLTTLATNRLAYVRSLAWDTDPLVRKAWEFGPGGYELNSYPKAALAVTQLEGVVGESSFAVGLREFFRRWRFSHPGTADFFAVLEEVSGTDLSSIERGVFHGTERFDHMVRRVRSWKDGRWTSTAEIVRTGGLQVPAVIEFRFTDGTSQRVTFPRNGRWGRFRAASDAPLESVVVDPEWSNVLETDRRNNVAHLRRRGSWFGAVRLTAVSLAARIVRLTSPAW